MRFKDFVKERLFSAVQIAPLKTVNLTVYSVIIKNTVFS